MSQEQLAAGHRWGYLRPFRVGTWVYTRATLRRFDKKPGSWVKMGPLIPCERRLEKREISEFQEVTFRRFFGNRDYDRPFRHFPVTLCRFD